MNAALAKAMLTKMSVDNSENDIETELIVSRYASLGRLLLRRQRCLEAEVGLENLLI